MMGKPIRMIVITLAIASLLAAGAAVFINVNTGVDAAGKDTSPVVDFEEHRDAGVINPKQRDTLDLTQTIDGVSMNVEMPAVELSATQPGNF